MLNQSQPPLGNLLKSSKDRAFGEYVNLKGHRCPCYSDGDAGPPQYETNDVYFCFAKFQNPFTRRWASRYAAMTILFPRLDPLHDAERKLGRPLEPPEWPLVQGVIIEGFKPMKTTAKGLAALYLKVGAWLKMNMIDEIDHRMVDAVTPADWKRRRPELLRLYGDLPWARLGSDGRDWMKLHATTNCLEMLRRTDLTYCILPASYVEPPQDAVKDEAREKNRSKVAQAIAEEESIETTAEAEQGELKLPREDRRYGD